jgi:hypothetical protein
MLCPDNVGTVGFIGTIGTFSWLGSLSRRPPCPSTRRFPAIILLLIECSLGKTRPISTPGSGGHAPTHQAIRSQIAWAIAPRSGRRRNAVCLLRLRLGERTGLVYLRANFYRKDGSFRLPAIRALFS